MKYKILWDYGSEGHSIGEDEYETIDEAVKSAVGKNYSTPFKIIRIYWETA